ncbi:HEAT repeat domain-containing protein [Yinghuangia seranimata]|uniref:HEAT repeat domain-containing protein n=1 Tax=Yinghuangia seranimata TaxID=408067 RepID=UPI00248AC14B|nr:HEAT repeat domain-containing protein [Yinghuangia seranimata]MDI2129688.1 HEAT repeat domain-containing protein [Yinghuangia seranimata]
MTSRARAANEPAAGKPAGAASGPSGPPPSDLIAQLRSGHGEGARRALAVREPDARAAVVAALDSCVLRDPRAVPATESRSLYYARLYAELGVSLDALTSHLICDEDWTDEDADRTALPLAVLGVLARAGRSDATGLLRRYAAEGRDWTLALDQLARAADPRALDGMLAVALERADDDELYDCVRQSSGMRPWRTWAVTDPRMRAIVEQVDLDWWRWELARGKSDSGDTPGSPESTNHTPRTAPAPGGQSETGHETGQQNVTVDQVLSEAAASPRRSMVCGRRLASVATAEHRGLILATAWSGAAGARVAALRYLGEVGDPALLDLAESALAPETPVQVRQVAVQAVGALRTGEAVARARGWVAAGGVLEQAAVRILAGAGEPSDGPALIAALRRGLRTVQQERFTLLDVVDGIGRLGLVEALEPVRDLYRVSPCAGVRSRAVETLARIDPGFTVTTAVDCLWDCEAGTRMVGVDSADTAVDGVPERLRELARDPAEDDDVRAAARRRLAAL